MIKPLRGFAMVPLTELHPSPNNVRERLDDLDDLAQSIREVGMIQPIIAQKIPAHDGLQIVAGHRRHAAARMLGLVEVPVVIRRDMLPDEELLAMLVENGQRSGLDPIEEARALDRLVRAGVPVYEVARKVGRSTATVQARLLLLKLPAAEQEQVRAGHYSLTHATGIVRAQAAAARRAKNPVARPVGRPKGATTKPYFGDTHPLATAARTRCGHIGSPKVAGVACGRCWEATIRADERTADHAGADQ